MAAYDQDWEAWTKRFDRAEQGVYTLFYLRYMWRVVGGLARRAGPPHTTELDAYFARTAVVALSVGIRREVDPGKKTASLARALQRLIDLPQMASRTRYAAMLEASFPNDMPHVDVWFDTFAGPGGSEVAPDIVTRDLTTLTTAAAPVKRYVDRVIAHHEWNQPVAFDSALIDTALGTIGQVVRRYHALRQPGAVLLSAEPVIERGFLATFQQPWLPPRGAPGPDWLEELLRQEVSTI